jgi:hypothetical protein
MKKAFVLAIFCLAAGCGMIDTACLAADDALPVYRCTITDDTVKVDGKLDDAAWKKAPVIRLKLADSGKEPDLATEVRLVCGKTALYVAFHCEDDNIVAKLKDRDDPVWREECVEVFICPSGELHQYFEINVNPLNAVFDACILNGWRMTKPRRFIKGMKELNIRKLKTAVHVDGKVGEPGGAKSWTVEYAIPLREMIGAPNTPPKPGDEWRLNLYRIDHPEKGRTEESAWSPTVTLDFHRPWRFGTLKFVK